MTKKKRFGISQALTRGLSETINVVENNSGIYRHVVLPLSRIELDPDNPRKLAINLADVQKGIDHSDALYQRKMEELERLKELATTIKSSGIINPIVVYKRAEFYRVVAGERRCLASLIAGKNEIEARVFNEKPKGFELKLVQWIENTAREDLTLDERLGNIRELMAEYQSLHGDSEISATILKNMTGLSLPQTTYYLAVLNAPEDVRLQIENGNIRNLDKAALLANISSADLRRSALEACVNGSSLKELRSIVSQHKILAREQKSILASHSERFRNKINMGTTMSTTVVKTIIDSVLAKEALPQYQGIFKDTNWRDPRQVTRAFRKLIEILEVARV